MTIISVKIYEITGNLDLPIVVVSATICKILKEIRHVKTFLHRLFQ